MSADDKRRVYEKRRYLKKGEFITISVTAPVWMNKNRNCIWSLYFSLFFITIHIMTRISDNVFLLSTLLLAAVSGSYLVVFKTDSIE